jgi:Holliday junction resolvase RusA-like endonuclease
MKNKPEELLQKSIVDQCLEINIKPLGKPRMTRSDKWKKRDCVIEYWNFKDCLNKEAKSKNFTLSNKIQLEFYFKPVQSLSDKKKKTLINKPHQVKPDLDNCIKSVLDCLCQTDQTIYSITATKQYSNENKIIIKNIE